jgi:uncharacterized protein YbjT (DUF2867 family)
MTSREAEAERAPGANPRYLVFGASGYIGTNLVPFLSQRAGTVRAAARNLDVLQSRGWQGVELVQADALDESTLGPALADIDVAFYLVHSMASGRQFGELDLVAAQRFASAAAAAMVSRIVYLGGLVPDEAAGEHILSRRETGETLRRGTVPVTEVRAGNGDTSVGPGQVAANRTAESTELPGRRGSPAAGCRPNLRCRGT